MCVRARASLVACACVRARTRVHGHVRVPLHHSVRKGGKAGPHHLSATSLTETLITGLYTSLHHTHHGLTHTHTLAHMHTHTLLRSWIVGLLILSGCVSSSRLSPFFQCHCFCSPFQGSLCSQNKGYYITTSQTLIHN